MRILHVNKYFHEHDGVGRAMIGLMRLQEADGHTIAPFAMHDARNSPSPWSDFFVPELVTKRVSFSFDAVRQFGRALWSPLARRKMRAMLKAFKPDIVHVHNIYTHLSPSVLAECARQGIPVVMTVHDYGLISANYGLFDGRENCSTASSLWRIAQTRFIKHSFFATFVLEVIVRIQRRLHLYDKHVARFVTHSRFVRDRMVEAGYPAKKFSVVFPFSPPLLTVSTSEAKRVRARERTVLFVGRLEEYKGPQILLAAMRELPDAHVVFAGVGNFEGELRRASEDMVNVTFAGFLDGDALWNAMRSASVVVVPSLWNEPFGLVALEAMTLGAPTLVSDRGGLPEVVDNGKAGFVVKAGDAHALAEALREVFANDATRRRIAKAGEERAKTLGDPAAFLKTIMSLYEAELGS